MRKDDHPKVIVDDDFLDLRNPRPKICSRRPSSILSKNKDSCSTNTQGKSNASKDVLPGLQRLLTNFNQKNVGNMGYKKSAQNQPLDNRFRRKVEKPAMSSRSESILQEKDKSAQKKQNKKSHSSDVSSHTSSSESKKLGKVNTEDPPLPPINKPIKTLPELARNITKHIKAQKIISTPRIPNSKSKDENVTKENENILKMDQEIKEKKEVKHIWDEEDCYTKNLEIQIHPSNTSKITKSNDTLKNIEDKCDVINQKLQKMKWYDPTVLFPHGFQSIPSFKKSWTIPTLPVIRKDNLWVKHYNSLCAKVDRKTYEFDTDDSISNESMDQMSSYSSFFRSSYMNLIFCLGCLCGIFLVGGILTASEIQTDLFKSPQQNQGLVDQVSSSFRIIFDCLHQILTFPSTKFFRPSVEATKNWGIF